MIDRISTTIVSKTAHHAKFQNHCMNLLSTSMLIADKIEASAFFFALVNFILIILALLELFQYVLLKPAIKHT